MSIYDNLQASVHAKHTHVKMYHCLSQYASSFVWITPLFEFYCVAGPKANRSALAQSASKIVRWVQQEDERLFIIGGAVSFSVPFFMLRCLSKADLLMLVGVLRAFFFFWINFLLLICVYPCCYYDFTSSII